MQARSRRKTSEIPRLLLLAVGVVFVLSVFAVYGSGLSRCSRRGLGNGHSTKKAKRHSSDQSFHAFLVFIKVVTAKASRSATIGASFVDLWL
jgi:hypothetical protein